MAAPRKLPDKETLRLLRSKGWRLADIAAEYGVTEAGVWRALERAGYVEKRKTFSDILPWKVLPEHRTAAIMERFRSILRQQNGQELSESEARLLTEWLDGLERNQVVVNYHPEAPPNDATSKGGFYYTPRLKTDKWIIREPPGH